ncbi:MAG: hypothetical protein E7458_01290 [Ruminococcaceae bacterium]|nr:hypothetical protein [Oscillospiraceae bacterium]
MLSKRMFALLSALLCLFLTGCDRDSGRREIRAAYYAEGDALFGFESHEVLAASDERLCTLALQLAMSEPQSEQLSCLFPPRTMLHALDISGHGVVTVLLSEEYSALSPMERTITDYCMVLTLYELEDQLSQSLNGVVITVEGEEGRTVRTPDDLIGSTDWLRLREHEFTIYFPIAAGLLPNTFRRTLADREEPAEAIMEILMAGVQENGITNPVVNPDVKLLGVEVHNRVCYLDFSEDFADLERSAEENLEAKLYAIVNSLCELPYVDRVQFLIHGEVVESPLYEDFDTPYSPDEDLILKE